ISGSFLVRWFQPPWPPILKEIPLALIQSTGRLLIALIISFSIAIPVLLWSWDKPKLRQSLTTFSQLGASLPATALFPLFILIAVKHLGGGMELASIFLVLTGMIWYVVFNCVGGTATIPLDLVDATKALGLSRMQTWRKLVLPAIRPALITGAITAWGGGWNALVLSEYVTYKGVVLKVNGMGALLARSVYQLGDNRSITLCITGLVCWIIIINSLIWKPLYRHAAEKYRFDF
ncbi:ABC transporter permease subunit, partial [Candidatus Nomurabacteria bacterium]|nr:ABC transporter permease subunit [Candidatus Nomurabacteria bacterium]